MPRLRIIAAATALALIAVPVADGSFPGRNGLISFSSDRSGRGDVFAAKPDGSAIRRVLGTSSREAQSAWSPDGRRIAYRFGAENRSEVWVASASGEGARQVTDSPARTFASQPAWTPEGERIVFRSNRDGDADIWDVRPDGGAMRQLLNLSGDQRYPTVSPDGRTIAFRSDADGDAEILVAPFSAAGADGGALRQLTNNGDFDSAPSWSPDGAQIAFERTVDGNTDVYVMRADGSDVRRLTDNPALDEGPVFSPDGRSVVFTSERDGNSEIYVMNRDGANSRNISRSPALEESPDWQPIPRATTIRLTVSPRTVRAGRRTVFRIRAFVVRAGVSTPVSSARVRIGSVARNTRPDGRVSIAYRPRRSGRLTIRVSRTGHRAGSAVVTVRRP